jgi:Uma2 family endonuclease
MESLDLDIKKRYTYSDYLTWIDDLRRELIDGFINLMTPAPSRLHQKILVELTRQFSNYLYNKKCEVYTAPFDVRLPSNKGETSDDKIYTVVQPDICIICDKSKLDDRGCLGAPDLIVEIVSLSSVKKDIEEKFKLYEENGVLEYWIVQPNDGTLSVFLLENGKYQHKGMYTNGMKAPVWIFEGKFSVDLDEAFHIKTP